MKQKMTGKARGRMAPSPTGYMHLGNAWSFLLAWLSIRQQGGTMVLRMEDIDPDRAKPHYMNAIIHDLQWLGLDWDEGPVQSYMPSNITQNSIIVSQINACQVNTSHGPYVQSQCFALYVAVLECLEAHGHSYPCFCTRKELRAMAGAPHTGEACVYVGTCRNLSQAEQNKRLAQGRKACIRLRCPDETVTFTDRRYGLQEISLLSCGGDFAIRRSDGVFAYQLAVVIDDMRMGITEVVRGDDLLHCTPRQIFLQSLLRQFTDELDFLAPYAHLPTPSYLHVPLLVDAEGERFAKRHASLTIQSLREAGVSAPCILGYLAYLAGFIENYHPLTAHELIPYFTVHRLPKSALRLLHDPFQTMLTLSRQDGCSNAQNSMLNKSALFACESYGTVLAS